MYIGCHGLVFCIDLATSDTVWFTEINPNPFFKYVGLLAVNDLIYCSTGTEIVSLDNSGKEIWRVILKPENGLGCITMRSLTNTYDGKPLLFTAQEKAVVTIKQDTGEILGMEPLKAMSTAQVITLNLSDVTGQLYVGYYGCITCYNPGTFSVIWKNDLKGCGYPKTFSLERIMHPSSGEVLIVGINGYVLAIEGKKGATLWKTSLPGCGYDFVTVMAQQLRLIVASNGQLYVINSLTGNVDAQDPLVGLHKDYVSLASYLNPTVDFNSQPYIAAQDKH